MYFIPVYGMLSYVLLLSMHAPYYGVYIDGMQYHKLQSCACNLLEES